MSERARSVCYVYTFRRVVQLLSCYIALQCRLPRVYLVYEIYAAVPPKVSPECLFHFCLFRIVVVQYILRCIQTVQKNNNYTIHEQNLQPTEQPSNQPTDRPSNQQTDQPTEKQGTDQQTDQPTHQQKNDYTIIPHAPLRNPTSFVPSRGLINARQGNSHAPK